MKPKFQSGQPVHIKGYGLVMFYIVDYDQKLGGSFRYKVTPSSSSIANLTGDRIVGEDVIQELLDIYTVNNQIDKLITI